MNFRHAKQQFSELKRRLEMAWEVNGIIQRAMAAIARGELAMSEAWALMQEAQAFGLTLKLAY